MKSKANNIFLSSTQVIAETTPIFVDGFETGDFSNWYPVSGTPSVTVGDTYRGDYKAVLDNSGEYAQVRFTVARDHVFMRAYVQFKSFPAAGASTAVLGVYKLQNTLPPGSIGIYMAEAVVRGINTTTAEWGLRYYDGTTNTHKTAYSSIILQLDTWYCVEVEGKSNTTTDGISRIYIDGIELTNISKSNLNNPYQINCGYIWNNYSSTTRWYDCVVINDSLIGIQNNPPTVDAGGPYYVNEGYSVIVSATGYDPDGDALSYAWDLNNDGIFESPGKSVTFSAAALDGPAVVTISVLVTDEYGATATDIAYVYVENMSPTINDPTLYPVSEENVFKTGTLITLSGTFNDPGIQDTFNVKIYWDDNTESLLPVAAGPNPHSYSIGKIYSMPGVYTVKITVEDDDGGKSIEKILPIVIYNPNAGYVTGGGWIMSQYGAYNPNPTLTGKANFKIDSKYSKNTTFPVGETDFEFSNANFNFHSENYQWLVVADNKVQYKGTGSVNDIEGYGFIITATDQDTDKFRIKIWSLVNDEVIYDNVPGAPDDIDVASPQKIGGGNIIIHL